MPPLNDTRYNHTKGGCGYDLTSGITCRGSHKWQIIPAVIGYRSDLASSISSILAVDGNADVEKTLFDRITSSLKSFNANLAKLEKNHKTAADLHGDSKAQAVAYRDMVFKIMGDLRKDADMLETLVDAEYWPMPTYSKLLFNL